MSKMPAKRLLKRDDIDGYRFPSNFKIRKVAASRSYPPNCGVKANKKGSFSTSETKKRALSPGKLHSGYKFRSNFKIRKLNAFRDFPKNCGRPKLDEPLSTSDIIHCGNLAEEKSSSDVGESEVSRNLGSPKLSNDMNDVDAIAALPLRSVDPFNLDVTEKLVGGQSVANDIANQVCLPEETWSCKLRQLAEITAQIQLLLDYHEYSASRNRKQLPAQKDREETFAKSVPVQNLNLSTENRPSGLKIKSENDDDDQYDDDDEDDEISMISPAAWRRLQLPSKHTCEEARASTRKIESEPEKYQGIEIVDLECLGSENADCGLIKIGRGEDCMEHGVYASPLRIEQDGSVEVFTSVNSDDPNYSQNLSLINLSIVPLDHPHAIKVKETLNLFDKYYMECVRKGRDKTKGKGGQVAYMEAANRLKAEGKCFIPEKHFGHIPGVEIGDKFQFRSELVVIGLHRQLICGIDYMELGGKKVATSLVNSGHYENEAMDDVLVYSGQGDKISNQKLEKGNLALVNSMEMGYPVRVTYKSKCLKSSNTLGGRKDNCEYIYDGLYTVERQWEEKSQNRKLVFKFELHRLPNQPRSHPKQNVVNPRKLTNHEVCVLDDVSYGKERIKIRVMNGEDDDRPLHFTYMTKIVCPQWFEPVKPIGCNCIDGCSDLHPCSCVLRNGREIPFNEEGAILKQKRIVHECGPQCKCPPTCMNRVGQHGPKYPLEIFKTKSRGWGLRSRNYVPSGSFICEYIGELLRDGEADERISNDEYLFDIFNDDVKKDGFAIDAANYGNIGRFINHSCSPNLYAQEVLYDHDDKKMPHVMFFATKNIPPLKELTYDYNYKIDQVCDRNGNIKTKYCHCGSRGCTGRMY